MIISEIKRQNLKSENDPISVFVEHKFPDFCGFVVDNGVWKHVVNLLS